MPHHAPPEDRFSPFSAASASWSIPIQGGVSIWPSVQGALALLPAGAAVAAFLASFRSSSSWLTKTLSSWVASLATYADEMGQFDRQPLAEVATWLLIDRGLARHNRVAAGKLWEHDTFRLIEDERGVKAVGNCHCLPSKFALMRCCRCKPISTCFLVTRRTTAAHLRRPIF
jgi:hypothetical protein